MLAPSAQPRRRDRARCTAGVALRIEPSEYDGLDQPIEHPEALAGFFAKLAHTAQREAGAITRVAHYGDSAVAADGITSTARRRMQARFGDAGHGFILLAHGDMHYIHKDVQYRSSDGWEIISIVQGPAAPGFYGYGGMQIARAGRRVRHLRHRDDGELGKKVARFELFYQRFRGGGRSDQGRRRQAAHAQDATAASPRTHRRSSTSRTASTCSRCAALGPRRVCTAS